MTSRNKELGKNTLIFAVGTLGTKVILFLLVPLYSYYMQAAEFGMADLIVSSLSIVCPLFSLGIEQAIVRFGLTNKNIRYNTLNIAVKITILGGLFLIIANVTLHKVPLIQQYGNIFCFLYFLSSFSDIFASYAKANEKNMIYAMHSVVKTLTLCISNIMLLCVLKRGINGYIFSVAISNLCAIIFLAWACHIPEGIKLGSCDRKLQKEMLVYSAPLVPNTISWWVTQMSDRYILAYYAGMTVNGIYTMAYKIPSVFNLLVSIFSQAFGLTVMKEMDNSKDIGYINRVYKYYISITFLTSSVVIAASRFITRMILSSEYHEAWKYVPLLVFAYTVGNLQSFYGMLFGGIKKSTSVFITTLTGATGNIVLNFLFIPHYSACGAAVATIASYITIYIMRSAIISKYIDFEHDYLRIIVSLALIAVQIILYELNRALMDAFVFIV